jgi:hypothetical protein
MRIHPPSLGCAGAAVVFRARSYGKPEKASKVVGIVRQLNEMVARRNSREALWVFSLGSFHEPITRLQG